MSLILEALRKSEAERQRGMPPRLDSPMLRPTRRRQKLAPGLALLVLGAPAAGWFVYRGLGPEPGPVFEGPTVGEVALQSLPADAVPPASNTAPLSPAAGAEQSSQLAQQAPEPAAATTAVEQARMARSISAQEALGAAAGISGGGSFGSELTLPESRRPHTPSLASADSVPAVAPVAQPATPPAPVPAASVAAAPASVAPAPVAAPVPPAVSEPAPAPQQLAMAPAPAPVAAAPAPPPAAPVEVIPMIYELEFGIRRDLPKMDMSMHVYSADPQARFIVVNGKRFGEGEQPETEVMLREIRRDGAVLVYRGTTFVLPRQGF